MQRAYKKLEKLYPVFAHDLWTATGLRLRKDDKNENEKKPLPIKIVNYSFIKYTIL